jgi:hypothetical protein
VSGCIAIFLTNSSEGTVSALSLNYTDLLEGCQDTLIICQNVYIILSSFWKSLLDKF